MTTQANPVQLQSSTTTHISRRSGEMRVIELILGDRIFAIDLFDTREVINQTDITPLPDAPAYITGIINLRGIITTILDLRKLMKIESTVETSKKQRIIVLDTTITKKAIGILVDDVISVSNYSEDDIDRENNNSRTGKSRLGVIRKHGKETGEKADTQLIILIDIEQIIRSVEKTL